MLCFTIFNFRNVKDFNLPAMFIIFQIEYLYFQVIWLYNNQPVVQSKHLVITKDGNRHTLHIKDTKTTDFGQYTCYANNTEGSDKKNILLSGKWILW